MDELRTALDVVGQNGGWGALAVLATVAHFFAEPTRWWLVVGRRNGIKYSKFVDIFNTTALLSYSLPLKMGMPARHTLLKRDLKQRHLTVASALLLDTTFVYSIWSVLALSILVATPLSLPEIRFASPMLWGVIAVGATLVGLGLAAVKRVGGPRRVRAAWQELRGMLGARALAWSSLTVLADIAVQGVKHWAVFELLGLEVSFQWSLAIAIVAITSGLISFLPLGLGAYDGVLIALLAVISGSALGVWLAPIVVRGVNLGVAGILGALGATRLGVSTKKIREKADGA